MEKNPNEIKKKELETFTCPQSIIKLPTNYQQNSTLDGQN